jgi:hypothetical protein
MNTLDTVEKQVETVNRFFEEQSARSKELQYTEDRFALAA